MEDLVVIVAILFIVGWVVKVVVTFIISVIIWPVINLPVLIDKLLGSSSLFSPEWSWIVSGIVVGSLLHFVVNESQKLSNVAARPLALIFLGLYLFMPILLG